MNTKEKKLFIIQLSTFCINNCDGCVYTKKERNNLSAFSIEEFENIIQKINYYCDKNNFIPWILLGTGEVFEFDLKTYINIILKYNKSSYIELATTGKNLKFYKEIDNIVEITKDTNIHFIIEFVLDIFNYTEKDLNEVNNQLDYCKKKKLEIHTVLKSSVNYKENLNIILEKLKKLKYKYFIFDYLFLDNKKSNKLMKLKDFIDFFFIAEKKLKDINKNCSSYILNGISTTDEKYSNFSYGYYIDNQQNLFYTFESPFGDFVVSPMNSNIKTILNFKEKFSNIQFYNKLNINYLKIKNQNNNLIQEIDFCKKCQYNKMCPVYFINDLSKFNNIEFNKNYCLGGKQLLDIYEKNVKKEK